MLASPRDSCAGDGRAGRGGGGAGLVPPWRLAGLSEYPVWWGSVGPASFPWDGAFSPWVFFLCALKTIFALSGVRKKNILTW